MKRMQVFSDRVAAGAGGDVKARSLLEARAGQVIAIEGYRLDILMAPPGDFLDAGDRAEGQMWLQAKPMAHTAPQGIGASGLHWITSSRGTIGYLGAVWESFGDAAAGLSAGGYFHTSGWMPCGFDVPGLWWVGEAFGVGCTPIVAMFVHLLYEWKTVSPIQVAALYTSWGIDSVDAAEREVVGGVDFNMQMGPGVAGRPTIIG